MTKKRRGPPLNIVGAGEPTIILDQGARCKNKGGTVAPNGDCLRCGATNPERCR